MKVYDKQMPESCPCLGHDKFDCERHGQEKDSQRCYHCQYVSCPAFSSWWWFTLIKKKNIIISKNIERIGPEKTHVEYIKKPV